MNAISKIVIVRRDNIGDLVCTTPLIEALRHGYPDAEIVALVNSYNEPVLRGNRNVDRVYAYRKLKHVVGLWAKLKAVWERLRLISELRCWRPDLAVLAKSGYDRHGLRFARQIGAKRTIGFLPMGPSAQARPDIGIDKSKVRSGHEVEEIGELLAPLGLRASFGKLSVFPDADAVEKLKAKIPSRDPLIAVHISAREQDRRLGLQKFSELSSKILGEWPEAYLLIFWAPGKADDPFHPGDDDSAVLLTRQVNSSRLLPVATSGLNELIAALSLCDVFIGADGGAMHLAAALNKPTVALFENTAAKLQHWYPWGVPHRLVCGSRHEVSSISVEKILRALRELVRETSCLSKH